MASMMTYRNDSTPVPSLILEVRDWETLTNFMKTDADYVDIVYELSTLVRVTPAPTNQTPITSTKFTVGQLTLLYEHFYPINITLSNGARNRFKAAITTSGATTGVLLTMLTDKDAEVSAIETAAQSGARTIGRKWLRKTG